VDADQPDDLHLPYLETFSKAAELSSFTAAAKALRLSQAAVSQRVQAIEKTLDTALFKRQGGRVQLTAAGQKLYDYAQRILDLHREARREVTDHEGRRRGPQPLGDILLPSYTFPLLVLLSRIRGGERLLPSRRPP
jgi:DNA-binding transcriptional LysR family regulator